MKRQIGKFSRRAVAALAMSLAALGCAEREWKPIDAGEPGGLTFDFAAISARRFTVKDGSSVPFEAWNGSYCYMHNADIASDDPRRKAIRNEVTFTKENGEAHILKKPSLVDVCRGADIAKNVSGGFQQDVKLPDDAGGLYRLSFRYRMRHDVGSFGGVLFTPKRAKSSQPKGQNAPGDTAPRLQVFPLDDLWSEWGLYSRDVVVPAGCDAVNLVLRIDGVGEMRFRDVSFERRRFDSPISLKAFPADWLDGTFAFSAGQCALPVWMWRKNLQGERYDRRDRFTFVLSLPKGYEYVDSTMALTGGVVRTGRPDGGATWRLPANPSYAGCIVGAEYNGWSVLSALVRADPDAAPGEMEMYAEYDGKRITDVAKTKVFTVPALSAKAPKRYSNGFYPGGPYPYFRTAAGREGFADMFTAAGANWVVAMRPDADTLSAWRSRGVSRVTPESYFVANGFRVGPFDKRPEEDRYVALPGGTHQELKRASCPIAVYEESPYFRTNTVPMLKEFLAGCDGMWANWEPYMFAGRGCMCARCRAAFAKHVGVTDGEMAKDWPQELAYGRKWYGQIRKFRSLEHAKVVKTIDRYVREFTGGRDSLGFIPGIAWCEMSSAWRPKNLAAEVQAIDYAGALKWIDPWGPYPWWDASRSYQPGTDRYLEYFIAARDVRGQVDRDYGKSAPKLMSFPHGIQCTTCITQPEGIGLALDSFFFNRWEASIPYAFPKGCDARWWKAFADATTRAATYEDYVLDGRLCSGEVSLELDPAKPFPPPVEKVCAPYLDDALNVSLLQHVAYELDGRRIVAVFNFAERDVAHFTLRASGMKSGRYRLEGQSCTAAQLEKGVALAVAPSRCRVFEITKE